MRSLCRKLIDKVKNMKIYERIIFSVLLIGIVLCPLSPRTVDVGITFGQSDGIKGNQAIVYVDSGNGWNDEEGYVGTIGSDGTCMVQVKSYNQAISVRLDPIDDQKELEIKKIEIRAYGITRAEYTGQGLVDVLSGSINITSMNLENDAVRIVPLNYDPEIYMSEQFCSELAAAMQSDRVMKLILLAVWALVVLCRLFMGKIFVAIGRAAKSHYKICIAAATVAVLGSIGIMSGSLKINIYYQNGENLKYDTAVIYIDSGSGWNEIEKYSGNIRSSGNVSIRVGKQKKVEGVRIDPVSSEHPMEISGISVSSFGRTYLTYSGDELYKHVSSSVNVEAAISDDTILTLIPENEDPILFLDNEFCDEVTSVNRTDTTWKLCMLWLAVIVGIICCCTIPKKIHGFEKNSKQGMILWGAAIVIATVVILFWDFWGGDWKFTYTNILYQIEPFRTLGVTTGGLGASDMADNVFAEMWNSYENGQINNWLKYNVFGYSAVNGSYVLSPFMWLCYGVTSAGQLIRYILKEAIALLGMYLLLRNMKCTKLAAWTGGCIYMFSSAMVMWGSWAHTDVSCLGPLLFFCTNRLLEEYSKRSNKITHFWLCISFILYIMLIAGMPTYMAYFLYLGIAYELYNMWAVHKFSWKQIGFCVVIIALAVVLAGLMSFAYTGDMFFSSREYQEYRGGTAGYAMHRIDPWFLWSLLIPQLSLTGGSGIEYNMFSGIFVLFLIPAFFITGKREGKNFWGTSILVLLFLLFTRFSGYIFRYIPLINTSRKTRLVILFNFAVSILSALVISELMTHEVEKRKAKIASVVWILTVAGMLGVAWYMRGETKTMQVFGMVVLSIIALFSVILMVFREKKYLPTMFLLMTISFSGAIFAKNALQMIDSDAGTIPEATESIQYLMETASDEYRMATVGKANFIPNLNSYYGINNLCGHVLVNTDNKVKTYLEAIDPDIYDIPTKTSIKSVANWNLLLYSGVRYLLVSPEEMTELSLEEISHEIMDFEDGECVVELKDTEPRVYIATQANLMSNQDNVLKQMMEGYQKDTIYVTDNDVEVELSATESGSSSHIVEENGDVVVIEAVTDGNGYLVLSDYDDGAWKVYVNGEEQEAIPCNYLFRAVYLDGAGEYTIEFVYQNKEKRIYWAVTMLAWIIFLLLLLMHKRMARVIIKCSEKL